MLLLLFIASLLSGWLILKMNLASLPSKNSLTKRKSVPSLASNANPIYVDGSDSSNDWDDCEHVTGSGTYDNPYIIENLVIDAYSEIGIEIHNTKAYLIIRNCTIENGSTNENDGIYLDTCANVTITDNELDNNWNGIYIGSSNNLTVSNNTCSHNDNKGIQVYLSKYTFVLENDCYNNEDYGIFLMGSDNNTISNNKCLKNYEGIRSSFSDTNNVSDNTCNNNQADGIHLQSSDKISVLNNTCSDNYGYGIALEGSNNNIIKQNNLRYNAKGCIEEDDSSNGNIIEDNTCEKLEEETDDGGDQDNGESILGFTPLLFMIFGAVTIMILIKKTLKQNYYDNSRI